MLNRESSGHDVWFGRKRSEHIELAGNGRVQAACFSGTFHFQYLQP